MTTTFRAVSTFSIALLLAFTFALSALAHSAVAPGETAPSKYETFTLSVPTEKDVPTTAVRLLVPETLERVTPFVKPGWQIQIKKEGERVTEVVWTGGSIPAGQKDVFEFTARTPAEPTTLIWKAYQTYADGEVVAWDQEPSEEGHHGEEASNPYSTTDVLAGGTEKHETKDRSALPTTLSVIAVLLALGALWQSSRKA